MNNCKDSFELLSLIESHGKDSKESLPLVRFEITLEAVQYQSRLLMKRELTPREVDLVMINYIESGFEYELTRNLQEVIYEIAAPTLPGPTKPPW